LPFSGRLRCDHQFRPAPAKTAGHHTKVVNWWKALIDNGVHPGVRDEGLLRLEGEEYIVGDGDVLLIRHE
jgi:ribosome-binding ATPase YchF (GTP1/OBG family)